MKSTSAPYSQERLDELEAALVELYRRQAAQPKNATVPRMRLAVLIGAFERRRDLVQAALQKERDGELDQDTDAGA